MTDIMNNTILKVEELTKVSIVACDEFSKSCLSRVKFLTNNIEESKQEVLILIGEYENILKESLNYKNKIVIKLPYTNNVNENYKDAWMVASASGYEYITNIERVFKEVNVLVNTYGDIPFTIEDLVKYTKGRVYFINEAINYAVSNLFFVDLDEKLTAIKEDKLKDVLFCTTSERHLTPYTINQCLEIIRTKTVDANIKYLNKVSNIVKDWFCITLLIKDKE